MVNSNHTRYTPFIISNTALAAALTCASIALTETGVEMLDLPVACSVVL